jgi:hypothetical protein
MRLCGWLTLADLLIAGVLGCDVQVIRMSVSPGSTVRDLQFVFGENDRVTDLITFEVVTCARGGEEPRLAWSLTPESAEGPNNLADVARLQYGQKLQGYRSRGPTDLVRGQCYEARSTGSRWESRLRFTVDAVDSVRTLPSV